MQARQLAQHRKSERGVTILLVAAAIVSLLAMAALAIDVVTLYVASNEAQRAADGAALSGAKAFVASGFTSGQLGDPTQVATQSRVCTAPGGGGLATVQAQATALQNLVAGQAPTVTAVTCTFPSNGENPQITVTIQQTNLPTFFAKIWGAKSSSVSASATAEAFNPSGTTVPVSPAFVRPWLIPNCQQGTGLGTGTPCTQNWFINTTTGYTVSAANAYIGQNLPFFQKGPPAPTIAASIQYYVMDPPTATICPSATAVSCSTVGSNSYISNIACSNTFQFSCGEVIGAGQSVTIDPSTATTLQPFMNTGINCLIHAGANDFNQGQDVINAAAVGSPVLMTGGSNNPNLSLRPANTVISRSDSIVTVPVYDGVADCATSLCTVIGFLQLGIQNVDTGGTYFNAVVLNAVGCASSAGTPVMGGSVAPLPVRLIHN